MVDPMSKTRKQRAADLEAWAANVDEVNLVDVSSDDLKAIVKFAGERSQADVKLTAAVCNARRHGKSWAEIGIMLGVSKQAAQRKYSKLAS